MITIYCGYSEGKDWENDYFDTPTQAMEFIESLRPATKRPSHIIIEGMDSKDVELIQAEKLYVPQIFSLENNFLRGGMRFTRKYFCDKFGYLNGGDKM